MANQGKGNFGDTEEHKKAGHLGGEATAEEMKGTDFYQEIGHKGGEAAQRSGHAHKLTEEERSKGGQEVSQDREHMSEIGKKGGQS